MTLIGLLASVAMAVCPPLVYADQAWSIQKKRDSEGFSKDVCAVLLIANITRCYFWLGVHFELPLLIQSFLMIAAQLFLLDLLIKFRPGSYANARFNAAPGDSATSRLTPNGGEVLFDAQRGANPGPIPSVSVVPPTPEGSGSGSGNGNDTGPSAIANVLGGLTSGGRGGYAPLIGQLPAAPTLGLEDGEDEDNAEGGAAAAAEGRTGAFKQRFRRLARIVKASAGTGEGKRADGSDASRPFGFWTWPTMSSYIIFLLGLVVLLAVLQVLLGGFDIYVTVLGYIALGLESTLPIPQAVKNQQRRSLGGFRMSVLIGWLGGDLFKTGYFFAQGSPAQFTVCALFQLSIDFVIVAQLYFFREQTAKDNEALDAAQAEALEAGQAAPPIVDEGRETPRRSGALPKTPGTGEGRKDLDRETGAPQFQIEADSDEER